MPQTKLKSLQESVANVVIGIATAFVSNLILFPLYGIELSLATDAWLTLWFTLISFARTYFVRRWFNAKD